MYFFRKKIDLISTNYGWLNKPMIDFLRVADPEIIIKPVGRPNFTLGGAITYQYIKTI